MKVIIEDMAAREFLAADGQWVADKADARDFFTLLRAYHFAQANISGRFRVLLHCIEDDYSASIIEGIGMADVDPADSDATVNVSLPVVEKPIMPARDDFHWPGRLETARNYLN
jgi:hypothetical protein